MGARFRITITPADVGKRVTIRSRIPHEPGAPGHTDTIGFLRSWHDGRLKVERRDGSAVVLSESALVGARVVGPPPVRRSRRPGGAPSSPSEDRPTERLPDGGSPEAAPGARPGGGGRPRGEYS